MSSIWTSMCVPAGNFLDNVAKLGWKAGPLGCLGDCDNLGSVQCRTLACCGPMQAGLTNKALGSNCCVGFCCYAFPVTMPVLACLQRTQVRSRNGIQGCILPGKAAIVEDCVCGFFCAPCVLQQCVPTLPVRKRASGAGGGGGVRAERASSMDTGKD